MSSGTVGIKGFGRLRSLQFPDGQNAPVSPPGRGAIRYNNASKQFEGSVDAGTYEAFGGAGGGGTTVADFAALTALDDSTFVNGVNVAVTSVRDMFELDTTSTLTVDGVTVLATASGTGRWVRRELASLAWVSQTTWHINAATGDDQNDGNTAGTALATHAELNRRLGQIPIEELVFVNVDSDLTEDIQADFNCTREGGVAVGVVIYLGAVTAGRTGTFTAGTQPWVYAPQASRQDGIAVDTGLGGGAWERAIGERIRVTSGAATDAVTTVLRNTAADTARVAPWLSLNTFSEVAGPSSGDDYVIEQLPVITGSITVRGSAVVSFNSIAVQQLGASLLALDAFGETVQCNFCDIRGPRVFASAGFGLGVTFIASKLQVDFLRVQPGGKVVLFGCGVLGGLDVEASGTLSITDGGTVLQNPGAAGAGGLNLTGPALQVDHGYVEIISSLAFYDLTAAGATAAQVRAGANLRQLGNLFGRDCTMSTGIVVRSGSVYTYIANANGLPDIDTPATQDTLIGGVAVAFGALPSAQAGTLSGIVQDA